MGGSRESHDVHSSSRKERERAGHPSLARNSPLNFKFYLKPPMQCFVGSPKDAGIDPSTV